jgi:hypothetical protein
MKRSKMTQIMYTYRNEDWIITIEKNNNGYYSITATGELYPVVEKITTDTLRNKEILFKQLIDKILDGYFWNVEA